VPHHKSARLRLRSDARKRATNKSAKSRSRTAVKKLQACTNPAEAAVLLRAAASAIDKAVQKGALHRGTANRQKGCLARYVNSLTKENP
jgi:small subunit ribosomal protein S20